VEQLARDLPGRLVRAGLPPWLWVWALGLYLWGVVDRLRLEWTGLFGSGGLGGHGLVRLVWGISLVVSLLVLAGVLSWFLPQVRGRFVERRYGLAGDVDAGPTLGAAEEIRAHVTHRYGQVEVRTNLLHGDRSATVYPKNRTRPALAVFMGLVQLWRTDRRAGEAVIDHELAHLRAGDHLVRGGGSLLVQALRVGVPLLGVVALLALLSDAAGGLVAFAAAEAVANGLFVLFLPVVALWLLELDADRVVALAGGRDGLRRALAAPGARRPLWRSAFHLLSHPPRRLRAALVDRWGRPTLQLGVVAAFPLAYLAQLPIVTAVSLRPPVAAGMTVGEAWAVVRPEAVDLLWTMVPRAAALTLLALAWPWLAPWWREIFRPAP
jgi:Zn-dependent protease with chaperone function